MRNTKPEQIWRPVAALLFAAYIVVMTWLLFLSETMGRTDVREIRYNLVPFREIIRYFGMRTWSPVNFLINVFGNIAAFMPYGAILPILMPPEKKRGVFIVGTGFLLSLGVELLQLLTCTGSFDVDDILLNSLGSLFGFILYVLCRKLFIRLHLKRRDRRTAGGDSGFKM